LQGVLLSKAAVAYKYFCANVLFCFTFNPANLTEWVRIVADTGKTRAAVAIQSLWRGYHARQHQPSVVKARYEIRSKRSDDHIRDLRQKLNRSVYLTTAPWAIKKCGTLLLSISSPIIDQF